MSSSSSSLIVNLDCVATSGVGSSYEPWLVDTTKRVAACDGFRSARVLREMPSKKPQVLFVLGGPGAGKGTQCAKIAEKYGYAHISAGDCLRAERSSGSADADLINNYIKEGKIVPVEITVKLLLKAMQASDKNKFLIDGFPRNIDNVDGWNRVVGSQADVAGVLYFDASEEVMEKRLLKRGETSGRSDDNIESIKKRFRTYRDSTMPVLHAFQAQGKLRHIDAGRPVSEVFTDVQRIVEAFDDNNDPSKTQRFTVEFQVDSKKSYEKYRESLAPSIRKDAQQRFGSNVHVTTRMFTDSGSFGAGAGAFAAAKAATAMCSTRGPAMGKGGVIMTGALVGTAAAAAASFMRW